MERICKDFGRIASDNVDPGGVNQHSTWKGSAKTLEGLPLTMLILGNLPGQSRHCNLERICKDFGRITSDNGDPQSTGGQSTLNLERIHRDFGRIASDNVDPGGVDRHSTWKGSAKTLEGSPLTMLILGGGLINTQLGKDLQRLWKDCL